MASDISKLYEDFILALQTEEATEKILELAKIEKEQAELRLIYFMQVHELSKLEIDGNIISLSISEYPSVLLKNYEKLKEFLGEDKDDVFTERPSKLKSYIKEMINKNKPIPKFINIFLKEELKTKRGGKGK